MQTLTKETICEIIEKSLYEKKIEYFLWTVPHEFIWYSYQLVDCELFMSAYYTYLCGYFKE